MENETFVWVIRRNDVDLKRGKTERKWHISFLAMLVLFLCAFSLRQPVYAEVGTDDETTAEGPAGTIDETAPEETGTG